MAHNSRIAKDGLYVDGAPPPVPTGLTNWYEGIDHAQAASLNGDAGGTSSPSASIVIGGAGMRFESDVTLSSGAEVVTNIGTGKRVRLAKTVPLINTAGLPAGTSRTIITGCGHFVDLNGQSTTHFNSINWTTVARAAYTFATDCVSASRPGMHILVPLRVHNGSVFNQATLSFTVVGGHVAIPEQLPRSRVIAVDSAGNITPLTLPLSAGGWLQVTAPGSAGAWNGSSPTIGMLSNIPVVDTSTYRYYCEIYDENGPSALGGNQYTSISANFINIVSETFS